MSFAAILVGLHSFIRWLVLLSAIIVIVKYAIGWLGKQEYTKLDRTLKNIFVNLFVVQVLLGFLILIVLWNRDLLGIRMEHMVTMIIAVVVAAQGARWNKIDDSQLKFRNNLFVILGALVLIFIGIWRITGSFI